MSGGGKLLLTLASAILALVCVEAQRGCPVEGCDSRGLNCQADFQADGSKAEVVWRLSLGNYTAIDDQRSLGCVGNDANIICKVGDSHSKGYVSVNGETGHARWYDTLMQNPRFPIMNLQGDIIATDGRCMEMRLSNGSLVGKPMNFLGYINDTSSIHYVVDPDLFFFTSYESGGIYMYDTSGMCVASAFLDVKDPKNNLTVSVWVPVNKPIVNTEMDPPCTYFIAQNNATKQYRMIAVNFNHEPPYLTEKWHMDLPDLAGSRNDSVATSRIISRGNTLLYGGVDLHYTMVIRDDKVGAVVQTKLNMISLSFASYDMPVNSDFRKADEQLLIWMNSMNSYGQTILQGWVNDGVNGSIKYAINLSTMFNLTMTALTSELMIFGYHPEDTTLVFAFTGFNINGDLDFTNGGNQVVAIKPLADGKVDLLWHIPMAAGDFVVGQLIGHKDNMLLAVSLNDQDNKLLGIKLAS